MNLTLIDLLDRAADCYGDRIIYRDEHQSVTFSRLNRQTLSAASYVAEILERGLPVVVMTGRDVTTPAAYLGIARAGCFYAPMDGSMPDHRLNQILEVIGAELMIVGREFLDKAHELNFTGRIVILEDILDHPADEKLLRERAEEILDTDPLYTIFTSGSTGKPKGVVTSHRSVLTYLDAVSQVLGLDESDVLGNQSPLDYIAAIRDLYLPLISGCSTFIIPKREFAMPAELMETLNREKITTLCWSSTGVEMVARLEAFACGKPEFMKRVLFSGSVISGKYLRVWQQNLPQVRLINQYGPTEATASCTYYEVKSEVTAETVLPIGKAYKNYRVYLIKEDGSEAAAGEEGEICVAGPALALGYYGCPELTAKDFVQNPLNKKYRELIYKTGDLGRMNEDGELLFCGRGDRQIKHMGHRIELEEIEIMAMQIPGVQECASLYHKEKALLYLFYVGDASARDITLYFRANMPAYMVPRRIQQLAAMPLLPNGKKDMQALKNLF